MGLFKSVPTQKNYPQPTQNVSPSRFPHHQCADPGVDSLGRPHLRINCVDIVEDSCPGRIRDHVFESSRTLIPSPLAIERERLSVPHTKRNPTCVRAMGQDHPTIYPSPLALVWRGLPHGKWGSGDDLTVYSHYYVNHLLMTDSFYSSSPSPWGVECCLTVKLWGRWWEEAWTHFGLSYPEESRYCLWSCSCSFCWICFLVGSKILWWRQSHFWVIHTTVVVSVWWQEDLRCVLVRMPSCRWFFLGGHGGGRENARVLTTESFFTGDPCIQTSPIFILYIIYSSVGISSNHASDHRCIYRIEMLALFNDVIIVYRYLWEWLNTQTNILDVLVLSVEMSVFDLIGLFQV